MNYAHRQHLFDAIRSASEDDESPNKAMFHLATKIETNTLDLQRQITELQDANAGLKDDVASLSCTTGDMTEEALRSRVRSLLVRRLDDATLTAAEIGQLKDVFGLASKVDELSITAAQFKCSECPRGDLANALNCNE